MNTDHYVARIVLVDDSENDNFFHEIAIKKAGFTGEIKIFEKALDAHGFLVVDQISVPTLLLIDINMPGMTGFELAEVLNTELQPKSTLHVHMLTSSAWSEDIALAKTIPLVDQYLIKPLTRAMAARLLNEADRAVSIPQEHAHPLSFGHAQGASGSVARQSSNVRSDEGVTQ